MLRICRIHVTEAGTGIRSACTLMQPHVPKPYVSLHVNVLLTLTETAAKKEHCQ